MKKKLLLMLLTLVLMVSCLAGCAVGSSTASEEEAYTEQIKSQSLDAVGLPNISNFYEMAQLKSIYELRDDPDLICYWYTKNEMTGKWVYEGKCMGYGIPYGASMTNSLQVADYLSQGGYAILEQAEPNGLYTSSVTTSATWILNIENDGNVKPVYVENEISVRQNKIEESMCEDWSIPSDY